MDEPNFGLVLSLCRVTGVIFSSVYSTRKEETTPQGKDEMEGVSGREVVFGRSLVVGPRGQIEN